MYNARRNLSPPCLCHRQLCCRTKAVLTNEYQKNRMWLLFDTANACICVCAKVCVLLRIAPFYTEVYGFFPHAQNTCFGPRVHNRTQRVLLHIFKAHTFLVRKVFLIRHTLFLLRFCAPLIWMYISSTPPNTHTKMCTHHKHLYGFFAELYTKQHPSGCIRLRTLKGLFPSKKKSGTASAMPLYANQTPQPIPISARLQYPCAKHHTAFTRKFTPQSSAFFLFGLRSAVFRKNTLQRSKRAPYHIYPEHFGRDVLPRVRCGPFCPECVRRD